MKKIFFYGVAVLIIAVVAAVNVNLHSHKNGLSDVSLANVEALARVETTEEFAEIGCEPLWEYDVCHANNGSNYTYAKNKE